MLSYVDFLPTSRFQRTFSLSPDGKRIAYVDDATGQFHIAIQSLDADADADVQRIAASAEHAVRTVAWSPNADWLVYEADTQGNENNQLYRVAVGGGGVAEPLTDAPQARFELAFGGGQPFSPDGKRLVYAGNDRTPKDFDVLVRDLESGDIRRIYTNGGQVETGYWSPDGSMVSMTKYVRGYDHIVYVLNTNDDVEAIQLTDDDAEAEYWLGPWLPDGSSFLVRTNRDREYLGLAQMDVTTGELTWLETPDWDIDAVTLSQDGRIMAWLVNVDGAAQLRARDVTTGVDLQVPELPAGKPATIATSPAGDQVVVFLTTATQPWNIAIVGLRTTSWRWLTNSKPGGTRTSQMIEPQFVRFPGRHGHEVPALLYRPHSTKHSGVLLSIHGGPAQQERPAYEDGFHQYLLRGRSVDDCPDLGFVSR